MKVYKSPRKTDFPMPSPTQTVNDPIALLDEARSARLAPGSVEELGRGVRRQTAQSLDDGARVGRYDQPDDAARKTMEYLADQITVIFDGPTPNGETRPFVRGDATQQVVAVLIPTRPVPLGDEPARELLVARSGPFTAQGSSWEVEELPIGLVEAAAEMVQDQRETPEPETVEANSPDED